MVAFFAVPVNGQQKDVTGDSAKTAQIDRTQSRQKFQNPGSVRLDDGSLCGFSCFVSTIGLKHG